MKKREWLKEKIFTDYYGNPFSITKSPILMDKYERMFFTYQKSREQVLQKLNLSHNEIDTIYKQYIIEINKLSKYIKIFNLGLFKTGTHSFNNLMLKLNLISLHEAPITEYNDNDLKRRIMYVDAISGTLVQNYKKIYKIFPNSKYVLTIRNSEHWLKSMRLQFSEQNYDTSNLKGLKKYHHEKVKESLFGTSKIWKISDKELILKYNKINEEVKSFFKNKNNFMELNFIDSTDKNSLMKKLLNFLEINYDSNLEFPHSYKSDYRKI